MNHAAEALKDEGNKLFVAKQWRAAYRKYSAAIKLDKGCAVYYSNRAACSLSMKEFMTAISDAKKATELDPIYAKAWSRLATAHCALDHWKSGVQAWETALTCLPTEKQMSDTEKKLKLQYEEELEKARKAKAENERPKEMVMSSGQPPWICAANLIQQLPQESIPSSGLVMYAAYENFKRGVDKMQAIKLQNVNGRQVLVGKTGAIIDISEGLMCDFRVFHINSRDWQAMYNKQVSLELEQAKAFKGGAKEVIKEAPKRLKKVGWSALRVSLSMTIRAWIVTGAVMTHFRKLTLAVDCLSNAVELLTWGSRTWKDVPFEDRGIIFRQTFIRGVKRLHIMAIHAALVLSSECPYDLDKLYELATDLVQDMLVTQAQDPKLLDGTMEDAQFLFSFWLYPHAEALAILGWCDLQRGFGAKDGVAANFLFGLSMQHYENASSSVPQDDENTVLYLTAALESAAYANKPWSKTKQLLQQMELSAQKMMRIWAHSSMKAARDEVYSSFTKFFQRAEKAEKEGRISETSIVKSEHLRARDRFGVPSTVYL